MTDGSLEPVRLAAEAMATRFELVILHADPVLARAAGEEALREVVRLEDPLSFYRPGGALGRMNRRAGSETARVPAILFGLLERCLDLHRSANGRFDPTVGPLMRAWGLAGGPHRVPTDEELEAVMGSTGFEHVLLDSAIRGVRFDRPGIEIDLGGVAKGFAVDEAIALLEEAGVDNALLHGGTSTVRAIGDGPDGEGWRIGIPAPGSDRLLATVVLRNEALSVSEISGKGFEKDGTFYGHVLDPASGSPISGAVLSAVVGPDATGTDALSTALLVLGSNARAASAFRDPRHRWLVAVPGPDGMRLVESGLPPHPTDR